VHILKATKSDLSDLVKMGRAFFYEAQWDKVGIKWDDESAFTALEGMLEDEDTIIFIAKENKAIGMIGGLIYPVWYNLKMKMAQEFFWYVTPEKRKGVGIKLLSALEQEVKSRGIVPFTMLSVEGMPELQQLYSRLGYAPSERTFIKRL